MPPTAAEAEEEAGVSSPNSTISSINGKRSERDLPINEQDRDRASSRGISDDEDGDNSRKKLRLSKDQSAVLEESFKEQNTLNPKQKLALAKRLGLRPRQVEVWFQNRRARTKLKQTEDRREVRDVGELGFEIGKLCFHKRPFSFEGLSVADGIEH